MSNEFIVANIEHFRDSLRRITVTLASTGPIDVDELIGMLGERVTLEIVPDVPRDKNPA